MCQVFVETYGKPFDSRAAREAARTVGSNSSDAASEALSRAGTFWIFQDVSFSDSFVI